MSVKLFVCLSMLYVAYAAVAFVPIEEKPPKFANIPGCYLRDYDMVLGFGESFSPADGSCTRYYCNDDGQAHHVGCVPLGTTLDCNEPGTGSLAFPECCRKLVCPEQ
ncbi:uncharacterized protein LOC121734735 [Aricia agestis]|uniref:uncharacterized protein LOC121734735 n=1 Tax=Aricia agestis TaxID=91739 RepID=UPI001C204E56|nr:uncharacterized protein LOC121734735 [Aricia agestis]